MVQHSRCSAWVARILWLARMAKPSYLSFGQKVPYRSIVIKIFVFFKLFCVLKINCDQNICACWYFQFDAQSICSSPPTRTDPGQAGSFATFKFISVTAAWRHLTRKSTQYKLIYLGQVFFSPISFQLYIIVANKPELVYQHRDWYPCQGAVDMKCICFKWLGPGQSWWFKSCKTCEFRLRCSR